MDENRNGCFWCKHPICKSIFIALLVFFGAFAAFYVVTDWHFKRMLDPSVQMRKVEKMMMNDERQMDKMINRQFKHEKMSQKDIKIEDRFKNLENYIRNIYPKMEIKYKWSTEDCISLDKLP